MGAVESEREEKEKMTLTQHDLVTQQLIAHDCNDPTACNLLSHFPYLSDTFNF